MEMQEVLYSTCCGAVERGITGTRRRYGGFGLARDCLGGVDSSRQSDDRGALDERRQAQFVERLPGASARLRGLIDSLEEQREELAAPKAAPVQPSRGTPSTRRLRGPRVTSIEADTTRRPSFEAGKVQVACVKETPGNTKAVAE